MTYRAIVERSVSAGLDAYGHPTPPDWQPLAVVPCHAWHSERPSMVADGEKVARVEVLWCALPVGADVRPVDRIARIEDRLGSVVFPGVWVIASALRRRFGYVEAQLERAA